MQLAARGVLVRLIEMRPERSTPCIKTGNVAELVCSNSFKSVDPETAAGSLKYELSVLGSKLLACAFDTRVAAGGALAVDRNEFSAAVQRLIDATPNIEFVHEECTSIPEGPAIIRDWPAHCRCTCLPACRRARFSRSCVLRRGSPHRRGRFD